MSKKLIKNGLIIFLMILSAYTFVNMYHNLGNIINNNYKEPSYSDNLGINLDLKTEQEKYLEDNYISKEQFYTWQVQFIQLMFCTFILVGSFVMLYNDAFKEWQEWKNENK